MLGCCRTSCPTMLYYWFSSICPYLIYCSIVCGGVCPYVLNKIEVLSNRAFKLITRSTSVCQLVLYIKSCPKKWYFVSYKSFCSWIIFYHMQKFVSTWGLYGMHYCMQNVNDFYSLRINCNFASIPCLTNIRDQCIRVVCPWLFEILLRVNSDTVIVCLFWSEFHEIV